VFIIATTVPAAKYYYGVSDTLIVTNVFWANDQMKYVYLFMKIKRAAQHSTA